MTKLDALQRRAIAQARAGRYAPLPFRAPNATVDAQCGVVVLTEHGRAAVVLSELPGNPGLSVTNAFEHLAGLVYRAQLSAIEPGAVSWFEHYPRNATGGETVDTVQLAHTGRGNEAVYYTPVWSRLPAAAYA